MEPLKETGQDVCNINRYIPVPREETCRLIRLARNGDMEARELLVLQNTGLVKKIAYKFCGGDYEFDDLLQIGYMGLIKAIDRFDENFGVMFSTYAVPMIMGEIKRYLRDDGRIKMGRQLKSDARKLYRIQEEYYNVHGQYPRISQIAEMMEVTVEQALTIMEAGEAAGSIESLDNENRTEGYGENSVSDYREDEDKMVDIIHMKNSIGRLGEKERKVIVLRYFKDMTQEQTAKVVGVSQVQVSRIEKRVLKLLRNEMMDTE